MAEVLTPPAITGAPPYTTGPPTTEVPLFTTVLPPSTEGPAAMTAGATCDTPMAGATATGEIPLKPLVLSTEPPLYLALILSMLPLLMNNIYCDRLRYLGFILTLADQHYK